MREADDRAQKLMDAATIALVTGAVAGWVSSGSGVGHAAQGAAGSAGRNAAQAPVGAVVPTVAAGPVRGFPVPTTTPTKASGGIEP
jgi:hypothetical protein